jgi:glutamyl-Q tRNA(Asp) synthetase
VRLHAPRNRRFARERACAARDARLHGRAPRAWRLRVPDGEATRVDFTDRWQGTQSQDLATEVGDFVLRRSDGQWAYQLAVVVDDADARITHVVRGADLLDSTARQIYLQRCLGVSTPAYLHVPVVTNQDGEKLSKQTGATALDLDRPVATLAAAARHLGIEAGEIRGEMRGEMRSEPREEPRSLDAFYAAATAEWAKRFVP